MATDMKHGASRELFEYWNRVRGSERAPHRGAIEPSDIRRILADTFILEVVDRETHLVRLAGTRVCSIYCRELKGTNFFDLWRADDRSAMATLAAAVTEDGAAAVVTIEAQDRARPGRRRPNCSCCRSAIRDRRSTACSAAWRFSSGPTGSAPSRSTRQTIASLRLIWPDETPQFMRRRTDFRAPAAAGPGSARRRFRFPRPEFAAARPPVRGRRRQGMIGLR